MSLKNQVEGRRGNCEVTDQGAVAGASAVTLAVTAAVAGMLGSSAEASKNIKVERVARGQARFDTRGNNTRVTVSDRAIINYRKFDIPRNNSVRFVQPSASSKVLNRINSAVPSKIDGSLSANGIVYLVNPAGVRFGPNSVINVGQLYAAAANISDGDFMNGVNRFVEAQGAVVNAGQIEADAVTLVGRQVINNGVVLGKDAVTMVSGEDVLVGEKDGSIFVKVGTVKGLTDAAATGAAAPARRPGAFGSGDMFSVAVQHSGKAKARQITVQSDGLTVVGGKLDASASGAGQKGGTVKVLGENVAVVGAKIDASGPAGGGRCWWAGICRGRGKRNGRPRRSSPAGR